MKKDPEMASSLEEYKIDTDVSFLGQHGEFCFCGRSNLGKKASAQRAGWPCEGWPEIRGRE